MGGLVNAMKGCYSHKRPIEFKKKKKIGGFLLFKFRLVRRNYLARMMVHIEDPL